VWYHLLRTGLLPSLIQGPLARFGDTAANDGVQAALAAMQVFVFLCLGFRV
jgi:hypothetical protein